MSWIANTTLTSHQHNQDTAPRDLQAEYDAALGDLPPKQRRLVVEYLRDLHQRNAAIRAGYSPKTADVQASTLLRKPKIRAAVELGMQLHCMPEAEVLKRLSDQARADADDFISIYESPLLSADGQPILDQDGQPIVRYFPSLDLKKARDRGKLHLIREVTYTAHGPAIKTYDAQAALVQIAKIRGMYKDEGILKYLDLSKLSQEQLQRIADGEDPLAVLIDNSTSGQSPA